MIFLELVLENFGPYLGKKVINLRPEKDENARPIILFGGMNGGGKTTLMDAIRLALYGHRAQCSTRGNLSYSDFLIQCINRHTPGNEKTRVELLFQHFLTGEVTELRVVRHWTKQLKDGKENLGILKDDWLEDTLKNIWDEYIENLLPLGISNLFLFDGEQVKELAELETPPNTVIEAIQSLLGLELAERLSQDLDILVNRKRKEIASKKQLAEIEDIEARLKEKEVAKANATSEKENIEKELKVAKQKQKEAFDKFTSEGGKIAAESAGLERQLRDLSEATELGRETLRELAGGILPLGLISPLLKQAHQQGELELKRQQSEVAREVMLERDDRLLAHLNQIKLKSSQVKEIEAFLDRENQALEAEIASLPEPWLKADAEDIHKLQSILEHQLPATITTATAELKHLQKLEVEKENKERQIAAAASPEVFSQLKNALSDTQKEFVQVQANYQETERKIQELERGIEQVKKELANYGEKAFTQQNNEHLIQSAAKVQKTLQLFRERLTLKKLNKLEGEVTECFRYLLHKSDLVHRVAIDTDSFRLSLYDNQAQPVPKHRLSAGEKQLLAIAFLWGLARVSGRNLPVAIDTPLGRLDSSHRNNLVERYFPTASHQVILLSTDTEIGENEIKILREQDAIASEYLLEYNSEESQTTVKPGYFW
ncbi:MAG: DNA sulfur modification protein DndD [Oscillatoria sp. PMC 1068.18]|nr:DNA sulfur modification protein DndD [Oscillatoria sp. PMC 1076.18]MEC4989098.1 DNA sulfur modification protein DndD [Oscillatoria sp. PMC 1068.18]